MDDSSWEKWGLAWDPLPVCSRYFEMHEGWRDFLGGGEAAVEHREWLMSMSIPVYMLKVEHDIPMSREYPMAEVAEKLGRTQFGTAYLESSIAYMMAAAMLEMRPDGKQIFNGDRIGIWGCDLATGGEYAYQRPNMEYLIGLARGLGIIVYVPPQNILLSPCRKVPYGMKEPDSKPERPAWMPSKEEMEAYAKPPAPSAGLASFPA